MDIQKLFTNKIFKIVLGVVVIVVVIGVGYFICQKSTNKPTENTNNQNNEQVENNDASSTDSNSNKPVAEEIKLKISGYDVSNLTGAGLNASTLASYKSKFNEFKTKLLEAINKYEAGPKTENKPEPDYFVELARYANYLGKKDWAKTILSGYFEYYENSSVIWNNLATIYEEEGNYSKANEYYLKILSVFTDKELWGLYLKIAQNYKNLKDLEGAHIYYAKYKGRGGFDQEMEDYLVKYFPKFQ